MPRNRNFLALVKWLLVTSCSYGTHAQTKTSDMKGMIWGEPELSMHCYGMLCHSRSMYGGVEFVLSAAASLSCWLVLSFFSLASLSSAASL